MLILARNWTSTFFVKNLLQRNFFQKNFAEKLGRYASYNKNVLLVLDKQKKIAAAVAKSLPIFWDASLKCLYYRVRKQALFPS